jgi:hypothetical protein
LKPSPSPFFNILKKITDLPAREVKSPPALVSCRRVSLYRWLYLISTAYWILLAALPDCS